MQYLFQATVYLLEHMPVILTQLTDEDIKTDVLPMIFSAIESNSLAIQVIIELHSKIHLIITFISAVYIRPRPTI